MPGTASPPPPRLRDPAHRVSPRARLMWTVESLLRLVVAVGFLLLAGGPFDWWDNPWWLVAGVGLAFLAYAVVVPTWRYAVHRWEVTDSAVYTQTGWWTRERRIAPMSRVQTVDYAEGAVSRLFGLAKVTVTTASSAGALTIDGLDRTVARQLVDSLTAAADSVEGDAT